MTTLTVTIDALCAALDTCPDSEIADQLAILADALEDAGDGRVAGLRIINAEPRSEEWAPDELLYGPGYCWWSLRNGRSPGRATMIGRVFDRLPVVYQKNEDQRVYPTRSAAFLALAAALAEDV